MRWNNYCIKVLVDCYGPQLSADLNVCGFKRLLTANNLKILFIFLQMSFIILQMHCAQIGLCTINTTDSNSNARERLLQKLLLIIPIFFNF